MKDRWRKHIYTAEETDYNHPLYNSIRKYGMDNFSYEILEICENIEQMNEREIFWVTSSNCRDLNIGYNIEEGGKNAPMPQSAKDKLSELNSGEGNPFYGKQHSFETKTKISKANSGRIPTEETRNKMSEAHSGDKNGMFGKTHTPEARKKISAARKSPSDETRKKMSDNAKRQWEKKRAALSEQLLVEDSNNKS